MAFPLIENGSVEGYFIAGPFVMKKLKSSSISNFVQMNAINDDELTDIMDFAGTLPVFTIEEISSLSILFYNSVVSTMNTSADYQNAKKDFNDQITLGGMMRQDSPGGKDLVKDP